MHFESEREEPVSPLRVCNVTISSYLTFLPFLPIIGCRTRGGWTWRVAVCLRVYTLDHCIGAVYKAGARGGMSRVLGRTNAVTFAVTLYKFWKWP